MLRKRGQVWVETVLYTLIGLALIGITLAIISPKISESKDRIVVEQSVQMLSALDEKINEVIYNVPGNKRKIDEFVIKRGKLYINSTGDNIIFVLDDLKKPYSEPGILIGLGNVKVLSEQGKKTSSAYLILDYSGVADIRYNWQNEIGEISSAPTPHTIFVENNGTAVSVNV